MAAFANGTDSADLNDEQKDQIREIMPLGDALVGVVLFRKMNTFGADSLTLEELNFLTSKVRELIKIAEPSKETLAELAELEAIAKSKEEAEAVVEKAKSSVH